MDIEERIRARIEAILTNDARNHAELERIASTDEPLAHEPFEEERNLYQRVIANYRRAVNEVNKLFEENIGFLSAFYRIVEAIGDKQDFQEICTRIVDRLLEDLGPEYGGIILFGESEIAGVFCLEGVREERKFLRVHAGPFLLGSEPFQQSVAALMAESPDCVSVGDVYREPRFDTVDFPSVVRSLVCLPIRRSGLVIGALVLSHSQPHFFNDNHVRVLKILATTIGHLRLLTSPRSPEPEDTPALPDRAADEELLSLVILEFEAVDPAGRAIAIERESLRIIRHALRGGLEPGDSILFHGAGALLVLLPKTSAESVPRRVRGLRQLFEQWRAQQPDTPHSTRLSYGYATCEDGDDLARTLEMASFLMHPEVEREIGLTSN